MSRHCVNGRRPKLNKRMSARRLEKRAIKLRRYPTFRAAAGPDRRTSSSLSWVKSCFGLFKQPSPWDTRALCRKHKTPMERGARGWTCFECLDEEAK